MSFPPFKLKACEKNAHSKNNIFFSNYIKIKDKDTLFQVNITHS